MRFALGVEISAACRVGDGKPKGTMHTPLCAVRAVNRQAKSLGNNLGRLRRVVEIRPFRMRKVFASLKT